jgi:hypothetical protein
MNEATKLLPLFVRAPQPQRIKKQPVSKLPKLRFRRLFTEKDLRSIHYLREQRDARGRRPTFKQIG